MGLYKDDPIGPIKTLAEAQACALRGCVGGGGGIFNGRLKSIAIREIKGPLRELVHLRGVEGN